jgi:hypothetical protein
MKTIAKRIVLAVVAALIVVGVSAGISVYRIRKHATVLLNEFRELGTSTNPTASFERMKQKYTSQIHRLGACTPKACQYEMTFSNMALSRLRVIPYTEMNLIFNEYDGVLRSEMLDYRAAFTDRESPTVHIEQGSFAKGCGTRFDVSPHGTSGKTGSGLVSYDQRATGLQRDAALALNVNCLVRLGGCKDIADLLPTMWGHDSPSTISSRLVGWSQELEESHQFASPDEMCY